MVAGMLGGHQTADINKPQQRFGVPLIQRFLAGTACLELGQLFVGVIDQRCQLGAGMLRHGIAQHRSTFSRMTPEAEFRICTKASFSPCRSLMKCSVPLGSRQCLRADDLAGCRRLRRIIPREQGQVLEIIAISSVSVRMVSSITTFFRRSPPHGPCKDVAFHMYYFSLSYSIARPGRKVVYWG